MDTPQVPIHGWMGKKKMQYGHTMEYYSVMRKEDVLPFVTARMDLEHMMLSEVSQRKTRTVWYHLSVESQEVRPQEKANSGYQVIKDGEIRLMVFKGIHLWWVLNNIVL